MKNSALTRGPLTAGPRGQRTGPGRRTSRRTSGRAARRSLERDLATYTSPAELSELDAILARHSEEATAEVRSILAGQRRCKL